MSPQTKSPNRSAPPEGLLLVDKPEGPTSHDVVARVRRLTGQKKVGHAGTLDPTATGLLPLVLGRATRLVRFVPDSPKVYRGRLRLGVTTATDDGAGEVVRRHEGALPTADEILRAAGRFRGRILQVPPTVSARKVSGQRLYRLALRGRPTSAPPTEIDVQRFDLQPTADPAEWSFVAEVSPGTYVRALARDLGGALGTGGILVSLRRTAIGPLRVEDAVPVDAESGPDRLYPALIALDRMPLVPPAVALRDRAAVRRFLSGGEVGAQGASLPRGLCRVEDASGALLGIGEAVEGAIRPRVVIPPPPGVLPD